MVDTKALNEKHEKPSLIYSIIYSILPSRVLLIVACILIYVGYVLFPAIKSGLECLKK
jgi:hypothetical protein